jgi:hypothetical protein
MTIMTERDRAATEAFLNDADHLTAREISEICTALALGELPF